MSWMRRNSGTEVRRETKERTLLTLKLTAHTGSFFAQMLFPERT